MICSDNSSLPEVGGEAAIMVPWNSDEQISDAMCELYTNPIKKEILSQKGIERSKLFSWKLAVDKLLEFFAAEFPTTDK